MPPPHAYQAMTAMADQALQTAMDTESVTEIAAALEEHHLYCHLQLVREARVLRDRLKKAAKKAKKQTQRTPSAAVAAEVNGDAPKDEAPNDDADDEVNDLMAVMPEPEPQVSSKMEDDDALCVICLGGAKSYLLAPCGHRCLCAGCAGRMVFPMPCPMCRQVCGIAVAVNPEVGFC